MCLRASGTKQRNRKPIPGRQPALCSDFSFEKTPECRVPVKLNTPAVVALSPVGVGLVAWSLALHRTEHSLQSSWGTLRFPRKKGQYFLLPH